MALPRPWRRPTVVLTVACAGTFALSGCTSSATNAAATSSASSSASPSGSSTARSGSSMSIPDIVDTVQPSVVTVLTNEGLGSGIVYSAGGDIVTDEHVVHGASSVQIAFADGRKTSATVTATDPVTDVALLHADRSGLPAAHFVTDLPRVGATTVVIGSPLGFEETVSSGIVSGLHRSIPGSAQSTTSLVDLLQTDAAISPGNSGGAVVDDRGNVVGMSEAYIPPSQGAVSIGFAIPAATVVDVVKQLQSDGKAQHAFLGLQPATVTAQVAQQLGLDVKQGAAVLSLEKGGPADTGGVQTGDVITALNGTTVTSAEDLLAGLRDVHPGDAVTLTVHRDGQDQQLKVTVGDRPAAQSG